MVLVSVDQVMQKWKDTATVLIMLMRMMAGAHQGTFSTLQTVQSHGVHINKRLALFSCEAEFMAATDAAKQAIWPQDLLEEITGIKSKVVSIMIDNKSAIALRKNPVFHGRSKHIHRRYHFIRECVHNGLIEVHHVARVLKRADILTKRLGRTKFKEMRELIGVKDVLKTDFKLKRENVDLNLK